MLFRSPVRDGIHMGHLIRCLQHVGERRTLTFVSQEPTPDTSPLGRAIKAAGSIAALAERIGVTASAPSMWKARGEVPMPHCAPIERETGVACEELRPDLRWYRVKDKTWPHPSGRPLLDVAAEVA